MIQTFFVWTHSWCSKIICKIKQRCPGETTNVIRMCGIIQYNTDLCSSLCGTSSPSTVDLAAAVGYLVLQLSFYVVHEATVVWDVSSWRRRLVLPWLLRLKVGDWVFQLLILLGTVRGMRKRSWVMLRVNCVAVSWQHKWDFVGEQSTDEDKHKRHNGDFTSQVNTTIAVPWIASRWDWISSWCWSNVASILPTFQLLGQFKVQQMSDSDNWCHICDQTHGLKMCSFMTAVKESAPTAGTDWNTAVNAVTTISTTAAVNIEKFCLLGGQWSPPRRSAADPVRRFWGFSGRWWTTR